jgi:hypothetical protein
MIVPGKLCPFGDGRHKLKVAQWGFACAHCSKTWEWVGDELVETYILHPGAPEELTKKG